MTFTFVDVVFEEGENFGLGLERHKLAYSVSSGRKTTIDCCIVTYSAITTDVHEGDILVKVNDIPFVNNNFPPPGHLEWCVKTLGLAKKSSTTIRFLRSQAAIESLEQQSDLTILNMTPTQASEIFYEVKEKEIEDKNKKRELERRQAVEKEIEKKRLYEEMVERARIDEENRVLDEETRRLEEHAAIVMANRARVLMEEQEKLRFELVPSQVYMYQHLFMGEDSLGLDIVPRQVKCVLQHGGKVAMDCCVVTDSHLTASILPGDIITRINGQPIAVTSRTKNGVAADFVGRSIGIINTAASPRLLEFMRPAGSTPTCPAGLNPYLIVRLSPTEEELICKPYVPPVTQNYVFQGQSIENYSVGNYSANHVASEEEIERRVIARMRELDVVADDSLANLEGNELLTEEEEITRRVAIEAKKFLREEMARLESDRLQKLGAQMTAEQAEIKAQRVLIAEEKMLAEAHTRKAQAEFQEREAQTKLASEGIRKLLEGEVRQRVETEMVKVAEEKAKKLKDLERQIEETGLLIKLEEEKKILADKEAAIARGLEEAEARKLEEENAYARRMDDEVKKRVAEKAKVVAEKERLEYMQHLSVKESKIVQEDLVRAQIDEENRLIAEKEYAEHEIQMVLLAAEKSKQRQAEIQTAFDYANSRSPATASMFGITFPDPDTTSQPMGLGLARHNVTYTDVSGKLQTIDCCMIISSALSDDIKVGDLLISVENEPLILNRSDTFETCSLKFFESVKSKLKNAPVPRTIRYYRLPAAHLAVGSLSMNASLSDALLLLSE